MITEEINVLYIEGLSALLLFLCNGTQFAPVVYGIGPVGAFGASTRAEFPILMAYVSQLVTATCGFHCVTARLCTKERSVAK